MAVPIEPRDEEAALEYVLETAKRYLRDLDEAPVLPARGLRFEGSLPEDGSGAAAALADLVAGSDVASRSSGPRFFHFVTGAPHPPRSAPTG